MIREYLKLRPDLARAPIPNVESYTPIISTADVSNGEIIRYFVRAGTATDVQDILEVSSTTYAAIAANAVYQKVSIRWKITGKLDDIISLTSTGEPFIFYKGVVSCNRDITVLANDALPGIKDFVRDYKRFWQGE